jgi:hypothetical protein
MSPTYVALSDVTPNRGTVIYCGPDKDDANDACLAAGGPGGARVLAEHPASAETPAIGARAYHDGEFAWTYCGYGTPEAQS